MKLTGGSPLLAFLLMLMLLTACAGLPGKDGGDGLVEIPSRPRQHVTDRSERLIVYQPQIISWEHHEQTEARAAVSFARTAGSTPALSTIRFRTKTKVDLETRRVGFSDFELLETRFPSLSTSEVEVITKRIEADILLRKMLTMLDHFVASVERSQKPLVEVPVKTDPPPIFVSTGPALLLQFDGAPILSPIEGSELRYALNTNWDILVDPGGTHYLLNGGAWLAAPAVAGPWKPAGALPAELS